MIVQYKRNVIWDVTLQDLGLDERGLVTCGEKLTAGAPAATVGYFAPGCMILNQATGVVYVNGGTTASPSWNALATGSTASLANGKIFVGDGAGLAQGQTPSGDLTMTNTGVFTIANNAITAAKIASNAVTTAKILNANVTLAKLAPGITMSHIVSAAAQATTAGGNPTENITVAGALSTDLVFVQLVDDGTNTVSVKLAVANNGSIDVTFSADPGNDAIINYQLLRAAA